MAIKIIKPGNIRKLKNTRQFTCPLCGCVFNADRGDYEELIQYQTLEYKAVCPTCHHSTYRSEPLEKEVSNGN